MVARGRGKKAAAAAASEAAVALSNGDGETQGNDEVAIAPAPVKKGRSRGAKKEVKVDPEESPPVEIEDKSTKAVKAAKGSKKVSRGKAVATAVEAEDVPIEDAKEEDLDNDETAEEKIKTAAPEKKTQRKRKADGVDKVEEPATAPKKASKTKTKAAKKETVDSAGVPEDPAAKLTPVLTEAETNGNKKSTSNRKRAAPKVEEPVPSADEEEQNGEEVLDVPPVAKKPSRGRATKKDAKKPAAKATKGSKKVIKAPSPEEEAPEDDVLPEEEFNPEEDKEEEPIPTPEPEPEIKAKKPVKSKGSRKQLKNDTPPIEEEVPEEKDVVAESPAPEEEVKKPKGRKAPAKKATTAAKTTSKKTTKAKKNAKAESAEESINDDQDAADVDITEKKTNGSVKSKPEPVEQKKGRGRKRAATTPTEIDEADGAKVAKPDGFINAVDTEFKTEDFAFDKEFKLKISSWNIAGLRSWLKKDKLSYLQHEQPDVLCLQEIKCTTDQLPEEARIPGYHPYWLCMPGGHAGVAIYSKTMPINVEYGIGNPEQDDEGRMITAEYEKFYLICVYVPNSGRQLVNMQKRLRWEQLFRDYVQRLDKIKPVIIAGDMNVSHKEIDLANPKSNTKNAGFTPEERDAMTKLLELGYVDTFRHLYPDKKGSYTFWSYMGKARSKNVGWRLDYFIVSERITSKVVENTIRAQVLGSDHCPITLFLNI